MNDKVLNIQTEEQKIPRDIMSPEGVEERVVDECTFRITLTQGGKHRLYMISNGQIQPLVIKETKEQAQKEMGRGMAITGHLMTDPKGLIDAFLGKLPKE